MSDNAEERDLLAAEYVLGTLEPQAAAEVQRRAAADPALARLIAAWEARLAPLATLADPAAEPPGLWEQIAGQIRPAAPVAAPLRASRGERLAREQPTRPRQSGPWRRAWRSAALWRAAALLALVAGSLGWALGLRQTAPAPPHTVDATARPAAGPLAVATLTPPGALTPSARVEVNPDGTIALRPTVPVAVEAGRSLAVWALPAGARRPVLVGRMPPGGGRMAAPPLADGSVVMVTLEPAAGPVAGAPPGRTLFAGVVTAVRSGG